MKILIVDSTNHLELIGGGHLFLPVLICELTNKGHEVHLVMTDIPNPKISKQIFASGANLYYSPWGKDGIMEDVAPLFAQWVNKMKPDIYLVASSFDIGWVALPLIDPDIATVTISHSNYAGYYIPTKHYRKFIDKAIGVSHEICSKYVTESNLTQAQIQWIPYGVSAAKEIRNDFTDSRLRLIFAGRIEEPDKRISDVVGIIKKLEQSGVKYQFTIAGDGASFIDVQKRLSAEIATGNVILTGWISGDKILKLLLENQIFILTSSSEGFSIALTEAMANGCCPIVTDIPSGSVQLITNNHNGFLIQVGDIDGFVEQIISLSNDKDRLLNLRTQAWVTGKEFSSERMAENYLLCFEDAIKTALTRPRQIEEKFPLMESCRSKYPTWLRRLKYRFINFYKKPKRN